MTRTITGWTSQAAEKKYAPYLEGLGSRGDLNYLFEEMLGEITVGHMFIGGGDMPQAEAGERRPARRGLQDRERPVPFRQGL